MTGKSRSHSLTLNKEVSRGTEIELSGALEERALAVPSPEDIGSEESTVLSQTWQTPSNSGKLSKWNQSPILSLISDPNSDVLT